MPLYDYYCAENDRTVEVNHPMSVTLTTWGEICYVAQIPLGETSPLASVKRIIKSAPGVAVTTFNSELKNAGFTKLVRRDDGVYENVTALDQEQRYMQRGNPDSLPHLHKKVGD